MEGSEDPNVVLPQLLFEQESHDLICPECDHVVTCDVILQKRKRELEHVQSGETSHEYQPWTQKDETWPVLSMNDNDESFLDDTSKEDDAEMRNALQEQTIFLLLCPDCESCITHEVILQKRKMAISTSGTFLRKKQSAQPPEHSYGPRTRTGGGIGVLADSDEEDPPLKRHRRSHRYLADTDFDDKVVRRVPQNQRIYNLSCPDCNSHISYRVFLKPRTDLASGKPAGLLEKKGRRRRRFVTRFVDDNPWKTRYKREHGHTKPFAVAKAAKRKKREEAQFRAMAKYGAIQNKSLAEPLLPVRRQEDAGEEATQPMTIVGRFRHLTSRFEDIFGPCTITYFLVLMSLYCVWWLLRVI